MSDKAEVEPLPGSVCLQRVRCGKPNCRCARGGRHAAYYRFWREGGRLRKAYVRRADVESTRAACEAWRARFGWLRPSLNPGRRGFDEFSRPLVELTVSLTTRRQKLSDHFLY